MSKLDSKYQMVARACAARRAVSRVSRQSQPMPSTDTSGSEAMSAVKAGLCFEGSEMA